MIASVYGTNLAANAMGAKTLPLPTSLDNVSVSVQDSAGVSRLAPLFFVSPTRSIIWCRQERLLG